MKEKKKYGILDYVAAIFCLAGCGLLVAQVFIDTETNLFHYALGLNGVGLIAFMLGMGKRNAKVDPSREESA